MNRDDYEMIQAIVNSADVTIRFKGQQYHRDHVVSDAEKRRMRQVLDAFGSLGGFSCTLRAGRPRGTGAGHTAA